MSVIAEQLEWLAEKSAGMKCEWLVILKSKKKRKHWLQLTGFTMAGTYPHKEEPAEVLAKAGIEVPPMLYASTWEPKKFCSYGHNGQDMPPVIAFVEDYVQKVLGLTVEEKHWKVKPTTIEDHMKKYAG
ncbi:MAG: hypothetical protein ABFS86_13505 [Planctomycetota bacterium]